MFIPIHMALFSLGVLLLVMSNFVWNTSVIAVGILVCLMAFCSVFFDPTLLMLM
jgi:hypothetical protein